MSRLESIKISTFLSIAISAPFGSSENPPIYLVPPGLATSVDLYQNAKVKERYYVSIVK